jgi:phosphoglycerate dehydrogenase-like enzyme
MQTSQTRQRIKAAFFGAPQNVNLVYAQGRRAKVAELTDLYPEVVSQENFETHVDFLRDVEVIFSTWGMPALKPKQLERLPKLKALFYAAGSVQTFARPFLDKGMIVVSAWQANSIPVSEFTLSQILLAMKGYFRNARNNRSFAYWGRRMRDTGRGNYGETVALLGAGAIGRKVIGLLKPFHHRVVVFDPFLSETRAAELCVEKVSLEEAFKQGYVISNHLANLPETRHMLHGGLFASMRQNATFINTGRGATVEEEGFIETLQARPDLTALLDVTWPEPPVEESPFYTLPNVFLTTHIAGSMNDETVRMADYCIEEFQAWQAGQPLRYAVNAEMLDRMA